MFLPFLDCLKIPYRHGKRTKAKSLKSIAAALFEKVNPEKCEELNKAVHKWFFVSRSVNVPISGPMLNEKALKFAGGVNTEVFQGSEDGQKNGKRGKVYISLYFLLNFENFTKVC